MCMKHGISPDVAGERIKYVIKARKMRDDSYRLLHGRHTSENLQVRDHFGYGGNDCGGDLNAIVECVMFARELISQGAVQRHAVVSIIMNRCVL